MKNGTGKAMAVKYVSIDLHENINCIKNDFGHSSDLVVNYFKAGSNEDIFFSGIFLSSLTDRDTMNNLSLELAAFKKGLCSKDPDECFDALKVFVSGLRASSEGFDYNELLNELLLGKTVFLINDCDRFFAVETLTDEGRSIEEPTSQTVVRGSKEGFTERILMNVTLIRKRVKHKGLRVEDLSMGSITNTSIKLMYIDNIAKKEIINEIKRRLGKIEIDSILESGYIEELIKDDRYSLFPTFLNSERPNSVASALLEGRVAILVDHTPYVLTAPALFAEFLQVSEDYYHHFIVSSLMRVLRHAAFFLTLLVPAVYIALTTFHQEMIPTTLLINIAAQREGVPFPALLEALIMEITFEILREAGIRMPKAIGSAISIVGALVLGQAAVEAGIVSAAMVIVVSITAISSFAIPNYELSNAIRVLRFALMLIAGALGLYGVFMCLIILVLHLCKIKSVTVPYLTPIAPKIAGGSKDTFFRFPLWSMKYRPTGISSNAEARTDGQNPVSPKQKEKPELR